MATDDLIRFLCLLDELKMSRELLRSGFEHLQEVDMGSTCYHLPHLSNGQRMLARVRARVFPI